MNDSHYVDNSPNKDKRNSRGLASEVDHRQTWPTPRVGGEECLETVTERKGLTAAVKHNLLAAVQYDKLKIYPTPCANEDAAGRPNGNMQKMLGNDPKVRGETPEEWSKGALNPDWTEWLMGWPIGWTNLEPIGDLDWRDWKTDPADEDSQHKWATPKASIDGTSQRTLEMVTEGTAEKSLMRQVLMEGSNPGSIPRVATGIKCRADRLKAIGNGQVPQVAALAWTILNK